MTQTTLGIEIDGDRVTVVESVGDMAVSMRTVALDDLGEAVDLALAGMKIKRNDPPIRISLAAPSMVARRIDVTAKMASRQAFEDAVYTVLPVDRETTCSAGMFFERTSGAADQLSSGAAAIATRVNVDAAYRALRSRRGEVVPAPFVFEGSDGLWLGVRYAVADLTLVVDGHVIAYRQLRNGGLDTVSGLLMDPNDPESGRQRLDAALHRAGLSDPVAESELDRWMRTMALEVRQTVDFWERSGETVPKSVIAFGPGAGAIGLEGSLNEVQLPIEFPEQITRLMAFIAPADRPTAVGAYMASQTIGLAMPQAAFVDPGTTEAEEKTVKRNRRALTLGAVTVVVAVVLASVIIPTGIALVSRASATHDRDQARENFAPVAQVWEQIAGTNAKTDIARQATAGEVDYASVLRTITSTAPRGYKIIQLSAVKNENGVLNANLSLTRSGGSYTDLTTWLRVLRQQKNVNEAWTTSFSNRDGITSFQLTVAFDTAGIAAPARSIFEGGSK